MNRSSIFLIIFFGISGCSYINNDSSNFFKENEKAKTTVAEIAKTAAESSNRSSTFNTEVRSKAKLYLENTINSSFYNLLPNWEIELNTGVHSKSELNLSTTREIIETNGIEHTVFWQGSSLINKNSSTINLGIGYRHLSDNYKWLSGLNFFYDHEFPYNHKRASLGTELKSSVFELNSNFYKSLSSWEKGLLNNQEYALDGYDLELGGQVPFIPSAKFYIKKFKWDNIQNATDLKGQTYSVKVDHIFSNGISIEAGRKNYEIGRDNDFVALNYSVKLGENKNLQSPKPFFSDKMFIMTSMENNRLEKVRRENRIVKQVSGFTIKFR